MESARKRKRNGDLRSLRRTGLKWLIAVQFGFTSEKSGASGFGNPSPFRESSTYSGIKRGVDH